MNFSWQKLRGTFKSALTFAPPSEEESTMDSAQNALQTLILTLHEVALTDGYTFETLPLMKMPRKNNQHVMQLPWCNTKITISPYEKNPDGLEYSITLINHPETLGNYQTAGGIGNIKHVKEQVELVLERNMRATREAQITDNLDIPHSQIS